MRSNDRTIDGKITRDRFEEAVMDWEGNHDWSEGLTEAEKEAVLWTLTRADAPSEPDWETEEEAYEKWLDDRYAEYIAEMTE